MNSTVIKGCGSNPGGVFDDVNIGVVLTKAAGLE